MSDRMMRRPGRPDAARPFLRGLGLAARAGRLRVGFDAVRRSVRAGEAHAVIVAGDAPEGVRRRLKGLLNGGGTPHKTVMDGAALGEALGRGRVVAIVVTDESLGRRIIELAAAVEG